MKAILLMTAIGHILTGCTDCMMTFMPGGRFHAKNMDKPDEMARVFDGTKPGRLALSILLGVAGMTMCFFGYLRLSDWMTDHSGTAAAVMRIAAVIFFLPGMAHHVICGTAEWFFVRMGRTEDALAAIKEYFKSTSSTMIVCYLGSFVYSAALFAAVVSGATPLPVWCCVFNPALLAVPLLLFRAPAAGNIAGAAAFLGLMALIAV